MWRLTLRRWALSAPGHIGREVIKVAQALGMKILAYDVNAAGDEPGIHFTSLEEVLSQSDYVSLHCPLMPQTQPYHQ